MEVLKGSTVVQTLSSSTPNDGSFSWTISTALAAGSDYRIRITSTTNAAITDLSNAYFTIGSPPTGTLTVTSPNGGEVWAPGSNHAITWTSSGTVGSYVKMEVLKGSTVVQTLSSSTPNDGSYSWTISTGLTSGSDYRIRITSTTNAAITDISNAYFSIGSTPPPSGTITVTSPNGGQSWVRGTAHS
ncbi:MAG: GPI anchored serine-threonine rich family protein, partial [Methanomicrobiales archaeon]|nr:GPI anchored serine-threonine rich family protein [Methanomicrobiales archaeon]